MKCFVFSQVLSHLFNKYCTSPKYKIHWQSLLLWSLKSRVGGAPAPVQSVTEQDPGFGGTDGSSMEEVALVLNFEGWGGFHRWGCRAMIWQQHKQWCPDRNMCDKHADSQSNQMVMLMTMEIHSCSNCIKLFGFLLHTDPSIPIIFNGLWFHAIPIRTE